MAIELPFTSTPLIVLPCPEQVLLGDETENSAEEAGCTHATVNSTANRRSQQIFAVPIPAALNASEFGAKGGVGGRSIPTFGRAYRGGV